MARTLSSLAQRFAPFLLPVTLLVAWQISVEFGWLSNRILPAPSSVITAGWSLIASGELWQHLAISGWRALIGFAIGGSIGLVLGFYHRAVTLGRAPAGQFGADDPQRSPSGTDSAGDLVIWH